ncbi:MAG: class I SAM-dependent methyltransferase [Alphaproteobacteria bacterium]|nr:class I SAM-dependent methyltransferase [Alphaproteobacteria bacterium]
MSQQYIQIDESLMLYCSSIGFNHTKIFRELESKTQTLSDSDMLASSLISGLICQYITMTNSEKILELGTYTGCSTLAFAMQVSASGEVVTCDIDREKAQIGIPFWKDAGVSNKIDLQIGDALKSLSKISDNYFDIAFIDADKENYELYYEECLRVVKKGGLIFIDNVLLNGQVLLSVPNDSRATFIKALNKKIKSDNRVIHTVLPISDGLSIIFKK